MIPALPQSGGARVIELVSPWLGKTTWDLGAGRLDIGIGGFYFFRPITMFQGRLKFWGASGGNGNVGVGSLGGGGGFAGGSYLFLPSKTYLLVVGGAGINGATAPGGIGGGGSSGTGSAGSGGGLTGLFLEGFAQPNALLIAGGGGGGGATAGRYGGAGGGFIGQWGQPQNGIQGGSPGGQAVGGFNDAAIAWGSALQGGNGSSNGSGGGGGGYFGGAAGEGSLSNAGVRQAGGGGSGYAKLDLIKDPILLTGEFGAAANIGDPDRQGSGVSSDLLVTNGSDGRAIIF